MTETPETPESVTFRHPGTNAGNAGTEGGSLENPSVPAFRQPQLLCSQTNQTHLQHVCREIQL